MKGSGKVLTEDLIVQKTKCASLSTIKNLNLWGSDIEDISILRRLPNAEVLSLSVNRISNLHDFSYCKNLQELYLRKNSIADIDELRHLVHLSQLKVLWLLDNPCTDIPDYRKRVIGYLPNLLKLDNTLVSPEEKAEGLANGEFKYIAQEKKHPTTSSINNNQMKAADRGGYEAEFNDILDEQVNQKSQSNFESQQQLARKSHSNHSMRQTDNFPITQNSDYLQQNERQNQNIVCAILSLMQDLDTNSLEIVRKNVLKQIQRFQN